MSNFHQRLHDFPALAKWYAENEQRPQPTDGLKHAIWHICHALAHDGIPLVDYWQKALQPLIHSSGEPERDFTELQNTLATGGMDIFAVSTEVAELAVSVNRSQEYFTLMQNLADKTGLAVFRFIAAWTALNSDDVDGCIDECEKVETPVACINTLHGQALLESGRTDEAIEVLKIAVSLSPKELLAIFQLAKAYHITDQHQLAWESMQECDALAPGNDEIAYFLAMIALSVTHDSEEKISEATNKMISSFETTPDSAMKFIMLCDLAFRAKFNETFTQALAIADFDELRKSPELMTKTAWILRELDQLGWQESSVEFLTKMTS